MGRKTIRTVALVIGLSVAVGGCEWGHNAPKYRVNHKWEVYNAPAGFPNVATICAHGVRIWDVADNDAFVAIQHDPACKGAK